MSDTTGCRYCGIEPDQEFPRPSYYEMRVERDEARAALAEAVRLLRHAVDDMGDRAFTAAESFLAAHAPSEER